MQAAKAMKVAELKAALEGRGLPTDGLKAVLLARLLKDMDDAHASATGMVFYCIVYLCAVIMEMTSSQLKIRNHQTRRVSPHQACQRKVLL